MATALRKRSFRQGRLSGQLADELERLVPQEFPNPGDLWPTEMELAERFRVSRVVVREAVKILEERGLVEARAGRGTATRAPSSERVKEALLRLFRNQAMPALDEMERMLELREVLEETAAGLAAVRATPEDLGELERALTGMADGDPSMHTQVAADLSFHLALARAAHNRYLEMVLDPLVGVFLQQISVTDVVSLGMELHRAVLAEIRRANPVGARQAVRRLMRFTAADLKRALAPAAEKESA